MAAEDNQDQPILDDHNPDDLGDWLVDIEPDHDEYVHMQFSEMDENGIQVFNVWLCPHAAVDFANAILTKAKEVTDA